MNTQTSNSKEKEMMTALMTLLEENRVLNQRMDKIRGYKTKYFTKYYLTHKDNMKAKQRERYIKDPTKKQAYYEKNKEAIKTKAREYYQRKKEAKQNATKDATNKIC